MSKDTALKGLVAVVLLTVLVGGTIVLNRDSSSTDNDSESAATTTPQPTTQNETSTNETPAAGDSQESQYTDGTYTASGSYSSPAGNESIEVTVTLENDVVRQVDITPEAEHPTSVQFQNDFIRGVAALVVGVPIDELDVDMVSGSSLTSRGFNAAIDAIQGQATSS